MPALFQFLSVVEASPACPIIRYLGEVHDLDVASQAESLLGVHLPRRYSIWVAPAGRHAELQLKLDGESSQAPSAQNARVAARRSQLAARTL